MSEPLTQAERAELVAEVTRQHEQSAFARKHMDLTDNSLLRYEATVAALTAENERLTRINAELCDALDPVGRIERALEAESAALPSTRETTDG